MLRRFGGTNGDKWFNDVWSYDPKHIAWTQLDCIGYIPAPREGHSAALVGDVMYIFGGRTEDGTDLGDLAAFRITARRWYTFQNMGPSPSPRSGHSMTSYGKQIVVLAGEPSSPPRDPGELSLVYVLDTGKIRYPNDQQIQQTPAGERVVGNRRPSQERGMPQSRAINAPSGAPDGLNRKFSGSRESMAASPVQRPNQGPGMGPAPGRQLSGQGPMAGSGPGGRGQDMSMANGPSPPGRASQVSRGPMAQPPSGPPPQQQAPPPMVNGAVSQIAGGPRSRTPTGQGRAYVTPLDNGRDASYESETVPASTMSAAARDASRSTPAPRAMSPAINGRRTPQQQTQAQPVSRFQQIEDEDTQRFDPNTTRSRSRQATQDADDFSMNRTAQQNQNRSPSAHHENNLDASLRNVSGAKSEPSVALQQLQQAREEHVGLQGQHEGLQNEHKGLRDQHLQLQQELDVAKSRNAWYASEMALARKSGYQPNTSSNALLDEKSTSSLRDEDQPLIEALIAVRAQLAEVRGSIAAREDATAQQVAEIEHQRDNAVREAVYAKTKLAAHGGSIDGGTPNSEAMSREMGTDDRSTDISRRLALALASQSELRGHVEALSMDLQNEKRARALAEGSAEAAHKRVVEFDQSRDPGEIETLRTELHQTSKNAREEAAAKTEAHAKAQMLEIDRQDLYRKHEDALENLKQHSVTLVALREAVTTSTDKSNLLERKLDEERRQRSVVDQKLIQLRSAHEERTAELDDTTRKLRDAEEMASTHAAEAKTHRQAMLGGLDKLNTRSLSRQSAAAEDERVPMLKQQVENAHALVRKNQADADLAAEKLRRAEERIAGLEAYQEQSSRESLTVRKQLQDAVKELQGLQARHASTTKDLETHRNHSNALAVKHDALKELLDERGISEHSRSRGLDNAATSSDTPDSSRLRELEQKYEAELQAHQKTKAGIESQTAETDKTYREKLELLENDYQSAVTYVKGTEKMLKRMKDELTKYKKQVDRLQTELDGAQKSGSNSSWEQERQLLNTNISELQRQTESLHQQLQSQTTQIQSELQATQAERDHFRSTHEATEAELAQTSHHHQQARSELEQLKAENSMLEMRALDAESKVTGLLDQVSASVGNYRRQSQSMHNSSGTNGGGHHGHARNLSNMSGVSALSGTSANHLPLPNTHSRNTSADPSAFPSVPDVNHPDENRNSTALDTLASELESLRSHWEDSHRTYRLSNQFDFERNTPRNSTSPGVIDESLADWRKRLSAERGVKGGLPRLSSEDEREAVGHHKHDASRESAIVKPHERMPGGISSDESDEEDERGSRNYMI